MSTQSSAETSKLDLVVKFPCLVVKMGHLVVIFVTLVVKITSLVVIVKLWNSKRMVSPTEKSLGSFRIHEKKTGSQNLQLVFFDETPILLT